MVSPYKKQRGLSLIELLVALAIALVLVIVVSYSFLGSKNAFRATDEQTQLYEEGRFALELLGKNIRSAGFMTAIDFTDKVRYFEDPESGVFPYTAPIASRTYALRGCAGGVAPTSFACITTPSPGTANAFTVAYFTDNPDSVQNPNGVSNKNLGVGLDCIGEEAIEFPLVDGGGTLYLIRNTFFLTQRTYDDDGVTKVLKELSCVGGGAGGQQPLFKGVHDMQIRYGRSVSESALEDQAVDQYFKAEEIEADDQWHSVINARVCLVMETNRRTGAVAGNDYADCDGVMQTAPAGFVRRSFISTFNLRNRVQQ